MLHDFLSAQGVRDACEISLVMPFGAPVPPSPDTSEALRRRVRGARHRVRLQEPRRLARRRPQRRRARGRPRGALRPLPRRPEASRAGRRHRQRHDRERLRAGELGDARDEVSRRVRGRGRRDGRRAEGRSLCGGRGTRRRRRADREAPKRRAARRVRRARLVLHRVRRRTSRRASISTSSAGPGRPAPTTSRRPTWSRRSVTSAPAGERAGSGSPLVSEARLLSLVARYPHRRALARRLRDGAALAGLSRLEARGLVTRRQHLYRLTRRGYEELAMTHALARLMVRTARPT